MRLFLLGSILVMGLAGGTTTAVAMYAPDDEVARPATCAAVSSAAAAPVAVSPYIENLQSFTRNYEAIP